jgi:DNA-directed RNA polymerase subunit H (RpoH/RPB5)
MTMRCGQTCNGFYGHEEGPHYCQEHDNDEQAERIRREYNIPTEVSTPETLEMTGVTAEETIPEMTSEDQDEDKRQRQIDREYQEERAREVDDEIGRVLQMTREAIEHCQELRTRNENGEDEEQPPQMRPRINTIKVLKVDLEQEEESNSKWLKHLLLTVSVQVIIQFLYGSCSRRRREQKEKITEDESKSGGDELVKNRQISDEEEEFELIQEENKNPEETPQENQASGSQEDPIQGKESEDEGKVIFVTRYGEVYHLHEDCDKTKGYAKYRRSTCKKCKEQSKEVMQSTGSSSSTQRPQEWIEQRGKTTLCVSLRNTTTEEQSYHHPTCPEMSKWKNKSKRVRCLICEGRGSKDQKPKKDDKEPTG